jgi:hypothetical protein
MPSPEILAFTGTGTNDLQLNLIANGASPLGVSEVLRFSTIPGTSVQNYHWIYMSTLRLEAPTMFQCSRLISV